MHFYQFDFDFALDFLLLNSNTVLVLDKIQNLRLF